ncbi:MAG: hypothetical protein OHK0015_00500 [Chloroflexi bacterium OHK40]
MFYLFLLAHLVADFALQPLWLVRRKRQWSGLCIHVAIVLACMLALTLLDPAAWHLWPAMLAIAVVHLAADRWKVCYADRVLRPPLLPFLLDQVIHVATLAVALMLTLPGDAVWSLDASPLALPALYASGYIVAALATPIALIVLLDPGFAHAGSAARARVRSLVAGAGVLTIALVAGPLALPLALAGLALAARRSPSEHPLDTPTGLMLVAFAASATGVALGML